MSDTKALIEEHAGKLSTAEIAKLAGVVPGRVRVVACENNISVQVPKVPSSDGSKVIYWVRAPQERAAEFAADVTLIMGSAGLRSQSAALVYAVEMAAQAIRDANG